MKTYSRILWCGLVLGLLPASLAADSFIDRIFPPLPEQQASLVSGIYVVNALKGKVECTADGRILDVKRGDKFLGRGSSVRTGDDSNVTLIFSNQTSLYLGANTQIRVEKFDQEPFSPNNDLQHEPSNSQMIIYVVDGTVVISTPQLYSGTRMVFESRHAGIKILNDQSGGEKAFLEVTEQTTHFAMIHGLARVNVRNSDGSFQFISTYVPSDRQAFVKYAQGNDGDSSDESVAVEAGGTASAPQGAAFPSSSGAAEPAGPGVAMDSFAVTQSSGEVDCWIRGRSFSLKQGDSLLARGAIVTTQARSGATLRFGNDSVLTLEPNTEIKVDKFDQEPFSPNNDLNVEPSNSQTLILVHRGRIEMDTPRLLSGTSLVLESAHGTVSLLNNQKGPQKAYLEVTPKMTDVQLAAGAATITPRNPDGTLQAIGATLSPGPHAIVKPTAGSNPTLDADFDRTQVVASRTDVPLGDFFVSSISGSVRCLAGGRAFDLTASQTAPADGAVLTTAPGARAVLSLSSGAVLTLSDRAAVRIAQFRQDSTGSGSGNLLLEPSIEQTTVILTSGSLDFETPQLRPESLVALQTPQGSVSLVSSDAGGDKISLNTTDKTTQVQLVAGQASVHPRGLDGKFLEDGTALAAGQNATVSPLLGGAPPVGGQATAASIIVVRAEAAPVAPSGSAARTEPGQAEVLQVSGLAEARSAEGAPASVLAIGDKLPAGSIIQTSAGAEVFLQTYLGAVADIRPGSVVAIEKLETSIAGDVVLGRTVILDLRKGTVVSMIDPAKRNLNHYAVRTPKGLAAARGTSFAVTVGDSDMSVAATADTVSFTTPSGTVYAVTAGTVTITPAGGQPQPPIPISQAVTANPAFAGVVQTAMNAVTNIVQNNIGNIPASSAANILAQVVGVASAAEPAQAASFASQAVAAATAPTSSTAGSAAAAAGAVTAAAVTAAPSQSAQVAVAAAQSAPSVTTAVAAAAAQANPTQAANIASAVVQANAQANPGASAQTAAQNAAVIAAAVTAGAPTQAASVAASVMQTNLQSNPNQSAANLTQAATMIASAVTSSAPSQQGAVTTALLNAVSQTSTSQGGGGTQLASAITTAANIGAQNPTSTSTGGSGSSSQPTAVTVNQGGGGTGGSNGGNSQGGNGGNVASNGGTGGNSQGGNSQGGGSQGGNSQGNGGNVASNGGNGGSAGGNSQGGNSQGGNSQGGGAGGSSGGGVQSTSVTITEVTGGVGTPTSTSTSTTTTGGGQATSVTVTALTGGQVSQVATALAAATNAQASTSFTAGGSNGGSTAQPTPNTPSTLPTNNVVSEAQ